MADSRRYLPSHRPVKKPPPMRLTMRDREIIRAVYRYRVLSAQQIEALFFPPQTDKPNSRRSACQRRLQLLFHHRYLDRLFLPLVMGQGRTPFIYALAEKGVTLLTNELGIDRAAVQWKPKDNEVSPNYLDHMQAINDVRVLVECLSRHSQWQVTEWLDDSNFRQKQYRDKVPFRQQGHRTRYHYPDAYFVLEGEGTAKKKRAHFFLELDRSTMTNARWRQKIQAYIRFRESGTAAQQYDSRNFRLLTVTTTERRAKNLQQTSEQAGANHYFWFTTQDKLDIWQPETLLAPIWSVCTKEEIRSLF